jgi:hypothetical protein
VLLSTFVVCVMIFMLARRFGSSTAASLMVALAFLCSGLLQPWGFVFRVDMPALAFELAALWVFQTGYGLAAVLFCVLAFFSKQSSVAAICAIALFTWFEGKRGRAVALAGIWLAALGFLTLLAQWLWPFYLANTVRAVSADYLDLWAAPEFVMHLIGWDIAISILALTALLYRPVNRLALLFLVAAALENTASSLRWGSNVYYFLPTLAALTIIAASEVDALLGVLAKLGKPAQVAGGVIVALLIPLGNARPPSPWYWIRLRGKFQLPRDAEWLRRARSVRGPVLTDWAALALVDDSPELRPVDLALLGAMRRHGALSGTSLLTKVRCRAFGAIALDRWGLSRHWRGHMFFWPELRAAIQANYVPVPSRGPPFLMLPRAGRGCADDQAVTHHNNFAPN